MAFFSKTYHPFYDYIRTLSNNEVDRDRLIHDGITKTLVLSETRKERVTERRDVSMHPIKMGFMTLPLVVIISIQHWLT